MKRIVAFLAAVCVSGFCLAASARAQGTLAPQRTASSGDTLPPKAPASTQTIEAEDTTAAGAARARRMHAGVTNHRALAETGGVDIICFLACLMSNIEAVYELRDCVDVFIGSEDLAYLSWFNGVCGDTNQLLTSTPELSSEDVGTQIVNFFPKHKNPYSNKLTMSPIRTDKITAIAQALDQLAAYHTSHWLRNYRSIYQAHTSTFLLADYQTWAPVFEVYDLKGYLEQLKSSPQRTSALNALLDVVITEVHGGSGNDAVAPAG